MILLDNNFGYGGGTPNFYVADILKASPRGYRLFLTLEAFWTQPAEGYSPGGQPDADNQRVDFTLAWQEPPAPLGMWGRTLLGSLELGIVPDYSARLYLTQMVYIAPNQPLSINAVYTQDTSPPPPNPPGNIQPYVLRIAALRL